MPELPEVETIKQGLESELLSKTVHGVDIINSQSMPVERKLVESRVVGGRVNNLWRRGKVMGIDLDTGYSLLIHLKMTGQLIYNYKPRDATQGITQKARIAGGHPTKSIISQLPDSSTRVIIGFNDGSQLYFNDQRKFGWIKLVTTEHIVEEPLLKTMGAEPLSPEFTLKELRRKISHRRSPVKATLLDQHNIAGIGNIYADESLHLANIHPLTHSRDLNAEELRRLHQAIRTIISSGIEHGGTTLRDYINHQGEKGDYLAVARVFGREGEACPVCGGVIEKIKVAGRGTHLCPRCQIYK